MKFTGWESGAVLSVLERMRPTDAEEVFALYPDEDVHRVFAQLHMQGAVRIFAEVVWLPNLLGRPSAFCVVDQVLPGVGEGVMLATDDMRLEHWRAWSARLRVHLPPLLIEAGLRRLQVRCVEHHRAAQRFLGALGLSHEGDERELGRHGETFQRWVALARDFQPTIIN